MNDSGDLGRLLHEMQMRGYSQASVEAMQEANELTRQQVDALMSLASSAKASATQAKIAAFLAAATAIVNAAPAILAYFR